MLEDEPERRCNSYHQYKALKPEIVGVWQDNRQCYGIWKVWRQLKQEDFSVARFTVARLMNVLGLHGECRGRHCVTTIPDTSFDKPLDLVKGLWKGLEQVELATLDWVDWFNNKRLLSSIGDIPPVEYEKNYYRQLAENAAACLKQIRLRIYRGDSMRV